MKEQGIKRREHCKADRARLATDMIRAHPTTVYWGFMGEMRGGGSQRNLSPDYCILGIYGEVGWDIRETRQKKGARLKTRVGAKPILWLRPRQICSGLDKNAKGPRLTDYYCMLFGFSRQLSGTVKTGMGS